VLVYTGDGKGKTTAALGLALRTVGHGLKAYVIQFMKGPGNLYGERVAAREYLPGLTIVHSGRDQFVNRSAPAEIDRELAARGLDLARQVIAAGEHALVILDEINVAADYGLVETRDVLDLVESRPPHVNIVLTGRRAPREFIEIADTVSEIKEIKHHYGSGVAARRGIEY
jgi:cob(I)alamin adenosyltransferase